MIAGGHTWADLQTYSLAQVRAFLAASERLDRRQVLRAALAARAAQASESSWKRFVRSFER